SHHDLRAESFGQRCQRGHQHPTPSDTPDDLRSGLLDFGARDPDKRAAHFLDLVAGHRRYRDDFGTDCKSDKNSSIAAAANPSTSTVAAANPRTRGANPQKNGHGVSG